MNRRWLIIVLVACLLAGCSSVGDDAESSLRQIVLNDSDAHLKLASFTKLDAHPIQVSSGENYVVTFNATIEAEADGTWIRDADGNRFHFSTQQRPQNGLGGLFGSLQGEVTVHQGQAIAINGTMIGEKTGGGWEFTLTTARITSN